MPRASHGRLLVTGHVDGTVKFWQLVDDDLLLLCWLTLPVLSGHVTLLPFGEGRPVAHLRFSQRHRRLVVAHASGQVLVYSFAKTAREVTVAFHDVPLLLRSGTPAAPTSTSRRASAHGSAHGSEATGNSHPQGATTHPVRITSKMVEKLVSYGFTEADVRAELAHTAGDMNVAAANLFEKSLLELDGCSDLNSASDADADAQAAASSSGEGAGDAGVHENGPNDHSNPAEQDAAATHTSAGRAASEGLASPQPDNAGLAASSSAPATTATSAHASPPPAKDNGVTTATATAGTTPSPTAVASEQEHSEQAPKAMAYSAAPGLQLVACIRCVSLDRLGTT